MRAVFRALCRQQGTLGQDLADADLRVLLAMAGAAAIVLAAAHLLDVDLFAFFERNQHFGLHGGARHSGLADLDATRAGDGQHLIERDRGTLGNAIAQVDGKDLAFFNFILAAAVCDDRVHARLAYKKQGLASFWRITEFIGCRRNRREALAEKWEAGAGMRGANDWVVRKSFQ